MEQEQNALSDLEKKELHKLLVDQLRENYLRYVDNIWKTVQFTAIGIGWFLTTANWKDILGRDLSLRNFSCLLVITLAALHIIVEHRFYRESKRLLAQIRSDLPHQVANVRHWIIPFSLVVINVCVIMMLFLFQVLLILRGAEYIKA
jgi:hypothetical protein